MTIQNNIIFENKLLNKKVFEFKCIDCNKNCNFADYESYNFFKSNPEYVSKICKYKKYIGFSDCCNEKAILSLLKNENNKNNLIIIQHYFCIGYEICNQKEIERIELPFYFYDEINKKNTNIKYSCIFNNMCICQNDNFFEYIKKELIKELENKKE